MSEPTKLTDEQLKAYLPKALKSELETQKRENANYKKRKAENIDFTNMESLKDFDTSSTDNNQILTVDQDLTGKFKDIPEFLKWAFIGRPIFTFGAVITVGCLTVGVAGMGRHSTLKSNYLMRGRIVGQAIAVGGILEGMNREVATDRDGVFRPDFYGFRPFGEYQGPLSSTEKREETLVVN